MHHRAILLWGREWESCDGGHRLLHCTDADEVHSCTAEEKGGRYEHSYGAPLHCSHTSLEFLGGYCPGDRLISGCTDLPWPPYSSVLNPWDYFFWEYLKERICDNNLKKNFKIFKKNMKKCSILNLVMMIKWLVVRAIHWKNLLIHLSIFMQFLRNLLPGIRISFQYCIETRPTLI